MPVAAQEDRELVRRRIEGQFKPGPVRDLALFQGLYSRALLPSTQDFLEALIPIRDKKRNTVGPWTLNAPQREFQRLRERTQAAGELERYATLKARQWGITRWWLGQELEGLLREPFFTAAILADEEPNARKILEDGKLMLDHMLGMGVAKLPRRFDNRSQLYLADPFRSYIDIETANKDSPLRSRTYRIIHGTEPARWKDPVKKFEALAACVPAVVGTVQSFEGTAQGRGNWWCQFWWDAFNGKNGYKALFFPFFADPSWDYAIPFKDDAEKAELIATLDEEERALVSRSCPFECLKWRRWAITSLYQGNLDSFHQEYPSTPDEAFLGSGRPAFIPRDVLMALDKTSEPIWRGKLYASGGPEDNELVGDEKGELAIWCDPVDGRPYVIGADIGHGVEHGDSTAFVVLDIETGAQVAAWTGIISPSEAGRVLAALGWHYNTAFIMPEINGPGVSTLEALRVCGYPLVCRRQILDQAGRSTGTKLGWETNAKTRPLIFLAVRVYLSVHEPGIADSELCREALDLYIDENDDVQHQPDKHDDRVVAFGIALRARKDLLANRVVEEAEASRPKTQDEIHWAQFHRECDEQRPADGSADREDEDQ